MSFFPDTSQWVRDRMEYIPSETAKWCGDISEKTVLDIGCGDMLAAFGLLKLNPQHVACVDVTDVGYDVKQNAADEIVRTGFSLAPDYDSRLSYRLYDGVRLPFPDNHFDLTFAWALFEHVSDIPALLADVRRVTKPDGMIFACVFPWYHSFQGSHLTDYIPEPFFHLVRPKEWVYEQLEAYVREHGHEGQKFRESLNPVETDLRHFLLDYLWPEYCKLNGYSARRFLADALNAGLLIDRLNPILSLEHLEQAPPGIPWVDLMTSGTTILLRPAKPASGRDGLPGDLATSGASQSAAIAEVDSLRLRVAKLESELEAERLLRRSLEESRSWRLTRPGRDLMAKIRGS